MECMAKAKNTSTSTGNSPVPEEMLNAIIKTFIVAHVDDTDNHLAQALVYNAARLAWRMRASGLETETKTSISDVVTAADRAAEKFITDALATIRPEDGVLGEEGTRREGASGRTWVIDPVDGTYNFTTGSDYWCSALALVEGDPNDPEKVIFGAVHRPAMGYTWFGGPEIPTTRDAQPVPEFKNTPAQRTVVATYLHPPLFSVPEVRDAWIAATGNFATVRMLGSASVDMAGVASGELGCWIQDSVAAWDWLPGRALVEGAGGVAEQIEAAGKTWSVAGTESAVASVKTALIGS